MRRKKICGIRVDEITPGEALKMGYRALSGEFGRKVIITSINPEKAGRALQSEAIREIINTSLLVIPDGIGIVLLGRLHGLFIPKRIPGVEYAQLLLEIALRMGLKIFLYGAHEEVVATHAARLRERGANVEYSNGYVDWDDAAGRIDSFSPHLLLIAMGGGKQEEFLYRYRDQIDFGVAMGVGGSFDVWAGRVRRAPEIYRKLGLEWLWRIASEPTRIPRLRYGLRFMACGLLELVI